MLLYLKFEGFLITFLKFGTATSAAGFYWFFYRNTYYHPNRKSFDFSAIFCGILTVGLAIFPEILAKQYIDENSYFERAFQGSSLLEEVPKLIVILWYFKGPKTVYNTSDGIYFGLTLGASFGLLENFLYSPILDFWPLFLRAVTSLPIHTFTGGIYGFATMQYYHSRPSSFDFLGILYSLFGCFLLHGTFNYILLINGNFMILLPFILAAGFFVLEYLLTISQNILPIEVLQSIGLFSDDYQVISRFTRYDSWMRSSQSRNQKLDPIPLLRQLPKGKIFISVFLFLIPSLLYSIYLNFPERVPLLLGGIRTSEFIGLFLIYPIWLSVLILFRGIFNPKFFRERVLKIPLFIAVSIVQEEREYHSLAYSLSRKGFYSPVEKTLSIGDRVYVTFYVAGKEFPNILAIPVWLNVREDDPEFESGAVFIFVNPPWKLLFWRSLVRIKQQFQNLIHQIAHPIGSSHSV
ncbi:PrsW family glutamic-type intramembrane protease [Leptospira borgpetersenii]|uniref:Protease PrsW family protein n=1 Tax=Leptospira borgpetersenii serovar Ballum TaxID=280505 RepID=A0A0E3B347_LEPBO|nr:PrsW family glutamic-type intramembrane protease [Leptospira borgpetersenii]ALO28335.1 protease PrsW family protein [Leptospira borgpetersenii serovar Ballum]APY25300.1 Protease PrsW family protein [Leptospira borgpetersenii str. 4E]EKR01047.1 protease PrsW family protein [Leptospira borgpetersenii serovar Castellonis str. 200801910]KGE21349.1 peptidase [Leptospira borgpetersenii serovar Ballum]MBE8160882.1 PrsW family intramembrane metalloprotease [Leptospira borgpetersenii serovar Ballum]